MVRSEVVKSSIENLKRLNLTKEQIDIIKNQFYRCYDYGYQNAKEEFDLFLEEDLPNWNGEEPINSDGKTLWEIFEKENDEEDVDDWLDSETVYDKD